RLCSGGRRGKAGASRSWSRRAARAGWARDGPAAQPARLPPAEINADERTFCLNSSTLSTQAMLRAISSSAIQCASLPRMLATQSEITIGAYPRLDAANVVE